MTAQDYIKQTGDPTDPVKIQAAIDYLAVFQKNRYDAYLSYSDVQGYTGFIAEGRARSAAAYYNQYLDLTEAINYYQNKLAGITNPPPPEPSKIVVVGELYRNGILISSGPFIQGDLDKLDSSFVFVKTDNPKPVETTGADPFAGGYDPITGVGLPFVRNGDEKTLIRPDGTTIIKKTIKDGVIIQNVSS